MGPIDIIIIILILGIISLAGWYVYRSRKHGRKCIGCPNSGCSGQCSGCQGDCHTHK